MTRTCAQPIVGTDEGDGRADLRGGAVGRAGVWEAGVDGGDALCRGDSRCPDDAGML